MSVVWICEIALEEKEDCSKTSIETEWVSMHSDILNPPLFEKIYTALRKRYDLNTYENRGYNKQY
jgi:sigma54-dependent transcription regulator